MLINKTIKHTLDKLVSLHLMNGLQPSEIADAIFEKEYSDIKIEKTSTNIHLIASFVEDVDGEVVHHKMRYIYDQNKKLQIVEQKLGKASFKIQWDREQEISLLLSTLSSQLKTINNNESVDRLMSDIPEELVSKIKKAVLYLAA